MTARGAARAVSIQSRSVDEEYVGKAVVIEIEYAYAVSSCLQDVPLPVLLTGDVHCRQAGFDSNIAEVNVNWREVGLNLDAARAACRRNHALEREERDGCAENDEQLQTHGYCCIISGTSAESLNPFYFWK